MQIPNKAIYITVLVAALVTGCTPGLSKVPASVKGHLLSKGAASTIPVFDHVIMLVFENRNYQDVIGNPDLPAFNQFAAQNMLLTQYHAVAHPSLPNYLAMIGGGTFGITSDCTDCFINQLSLPDLIEASGRTWKTYQEKLPSPCFMGDTTGYAQKHDPFIYFDSIRNSQERCNRGILPLASLDTDLAKNQLPDFTFIMPDLCNSGHDCNLKVSDQWLKTMLDKLQASPALGEKWLIFIVFDESQSDNSSCCGLPKQAGGRVPAILISPQAKNGFQDVTPYSHYSFLKTILSAWGLPDLGFTADTATRAITAPWK